MKGISIPITRTYRTAIQVIIPTFEMTANILIKTTDNSSRPIIVKIVNSIMNSSFDKSPSSKIIEISHKIQFAFIIGLLTPNTYLPLLHFV